MANGKSFDNELSLVVLMTKNLSYMELLLVASSSSLLMLAIIVDSELLVFLRNPW